MKEEELLQQDANMVSSCTACSPEHGEGPKCATLSLMRYPGASRLMEKKHNNGEALAKIHGRKKICTWSTN